jgi:hypothetical protein
MEDIEDNSPLILISPNPSSNNINIDLSAMQNGVEEFIQIDIFDLTGRNIESYSTSDDQINIAISGYSKGNYIVKISSSKLSTVGQFIVQ